MASKNINSLDIIKYNFISYRIFGFNPPTSFYYRTIYHVIQFPIHLFLSWIFYLGFYHDAFTASLETATEATSSSLALSNVSVRAGVFLYYRKDILKSIKMIKALDSVINTEQDEKIIRETIKKCRILEIIVHGILGLMMVAKILGVIRNFYGDRVPLFPIWLPYDWKTVSWIYFLTMLYQLIAIIFQVIGYAANQIFGPLTFCLMIAHTQILKNRLRKIGYDRGKSLENNHKELIQCAKMFNILYRIFQIYSKIVTFQMTVQFMLSSLQLTMTIVLTIYFTTSFQATMYAGLYVLNIVISEVLLSCWYGEKLKSETEEFTNAYYDMNWIEQTPKFKKDLLMLMQRSQMDFEMMAGFMAINLKSFVSILRFAYSASLILRNMKNRGI